MREPELMDDPVQARAYHEADFAEPHQRLVDAFVARFPDIDADTVVDLGCGPADVTVRVALALPQARVVGVDGAEEMLALGRQRVAAAGLTARVRLERVLLPSASLTSRRFGAVVSNSLLHHLHDPAVLWDTIGAVADPGAPVFVADLRRPPDTATVDAHVERYAAGEPEVLRRDFAASLRAAFTPEEIVDQLGAAGLAHLAVEPDGDHHVLVWGHR